MNAFPKLIKVGDFAKDASLTRTAAYAMVPIMPPGVVVRLNNRIRLNEARLQEWIESGGTSKGKSQG